MSCSGVCAGVMAEAWTFLDGECTEETYAKTCRHLGDCEGCLAFYALAGRMKNLIANTCGGERAPGWISWRR